MISEQVFWSGLVLIAALLTPALAWGHLFHFAGLQVTETQAARDFRLIKELIEWKDKHFDLAGRVYRGELRRRARNAGEPGFLLKARYQREPSSPPLKILARHLDERYGAAVDPWIEARLAAQDEDGVKAGCRVVFYFQIREMVNALVERGERPVVTRLLFGALTDSLFTAFEIHLALADRATYLRVKDTLDHLRDAAGLGPSTARRPADVRRHARRLLTLLAGTLDRRIAPWVPS